MEDMHLPVSKEDIDSLAEEMVREVIRYDPAFLGKDGGDMQTFFLIYTLKSIVEEAKEFFEENKSGVEEDKDSVKVNQSLADEDEESLEENKSAAVEDKECVDKESVEENKSAAVVDKESVDKESVEVNQSFAEEDKEFDEENKSAAEANESEVKKSAEEAKESVEVKKSAVEEAKESVEVNSNVVEEYVEESLSEKRKRYVAMVWDQLPELFVLDPMAEVKQLMAPVDSHVLDQSLKEGCPICHQELYKGDKCARTECGHLFDFNCLGNWLVYSSENRMDPSCPMCRKALHHSYI